MKFAILALILASPALFALTPDEVLSQKGEYSYEVMQKPEFSALIDRATMGELYADSATSSPSKIADGRFLVLDGCKPHECTNSTLIFIDSKNPRAILIVRRQVMDGLAANQDVQTVFLRSPEWSATVREKGLVEVKKYIAGEM